MNTLANSAALQGRVESIVEGANGRLFLDRAPGFDAAALYNAPFAGGAGLEQLWGPPLERLSRIAREIGAVFVLLIAPDAHGVETRDLPPGRRYARPSIADGLADLARSRGVAVVHPRDTLRDAHGSLDLFRRTDSHWSAFGAWLAYRELMQALAPCAPMVMAPDAFDYGWRVEAGDLGASVDPPRRALAAVPRPHAPRARVVMEAMNERRHALRISETGVRGAPSAVMMRDSYAGELAPFLGESFRRLVMVGSDNLLFEDLIREERPQAIIVERGERTLAFGLVDPPPFVGWREHWPEPGEGPNEEAARQDEWRARRALAAGMAKEALEAAEAAAFSDATPDRCALLGQALDAADRAGAADAFEAACALPQERPGLLLALGAARLRQGRDADARDLFASACILRPWSGEAYEHLGYAALRLQDLDLARYALERAVEASPHRAGGWLWLGELQAACGDREAASRTLARGVRACPSDPALAGALARLSEAAAGVAVDNARPLA